jgi:ATP-dependent DNA ligase
MRLKPFGKGCQEGSGERAKACELGLEGIVSKRAGSFYRSGKSRNWLKTKNPDFVRA